jgi:tetratricopeptide (TPR) repeat protein
VEVLQRARLLRARAYQDQELWGEAALQYRAALTDTRHVPADAALARYNLGLCYRGMELRGEAIDSWKACLTNAKPAEYTAAAIALAEAYLDKPAMDENPALEPALDALNRSVEHLKPGAKWTNPHVDRSKLLKVFERAKLAFQQAERFDLLYKLVTPQSKWLSAEASLVARAEAALLWGQSLKKSTGLEDIQRSNTLLHEAGELFEQASREKDLPQEKQAERLFQSALAFQLADDPEKGASSLFRLKTLPAKAELLSEANYRLGEYYRARGEKNKAIEMYRDCIKYDSRFVAHAHLRIALFDLEAQRMEEAEAGLVAILRNLAWDADPEIKAEALNALANLLYTRKDYRRVVFYLENALKLFNDNDTYRSTPNYTRLRFLLADSYQQVAALETTELSIKALTVESRRFHEQRRELFLQKAVKELDGLDSYLLSEKGSSHLTPKQRTEVPFLLASCLFRLGKYAEALKVYDRIASKNDNSLEYIVALGGAIKCLGELRQEDKIRQRLLQIENALPHLPEPHAQNWKDWVKKARMALAPIPE